MMRMVPMASHILIDGEPVRGLNATQAAQVLRMEPEKFEAYALAGSITGAVDIDGETVWDYRNLGIAKRTVKTTATRVATIYVIGFAGYAKIGWSTDVTGRIKALQDGVPEPLKLYATVLGDMRQERALHRRFAALRLRGEWFQMTGELADWIAEGCPI